MTEKKHSFRLKLDFWYFNILFIRPGYIPALVYLLHFFTEENMEFGTKEKYILRMVQDTLPDSATPFACIARQVGSTEQEVLSLLQDLKKRGYIRRFGATLRHQEAGFDCNVMVAWQVPSDNIHEISQIMVSRPEITHCYQRRSTPAWPFNLYTMLHGQSREQCLQVVRELQEQTGLQNYETLFSVQELKKTSMRYF